MCVVPFLHECMHMHVHEKRVYTHICSYVPFCAVIAFLYGFIVEYMCRSEHLFMHVCTSVYYSYVMIICVLLHRCVHLKMHEFSCVYLCIYVHTWGYVLLSLCVSINVCAFICSYAHLYLCACVNLHLCACLFCVPLSFHICVVYVLIHILKYIP